MAALTSAPFVLLFTFSGIFAQSQEKITVKPGDDVILPCQDPQGAAIEAFKWRRSDLESDEFVFFYRGGRPVENYQLKSYRGRVELRDPEMKNGDTSVILRKVTVSDTGTYQCFVPNSNRGQGGTRITRTISLKVTESGNTAGQAGSGANGLHGGLVTFIVVAMVCCTGLVL